MRLHDEPKHSSRACEWNSRNSDSEEEFYALASRIDHRKCSKRIYFLIRFTRKGKLRATSGMLVCFDIQMENVTIPCLIRLISNARMRISLNELENFTPFRILLLLNINTELVVVLANSLRDLFFFSSNQFNLFRLMFKYE